MRRSALGLSGFTSKPITLAWAAGGVAIRSRSALGLPGFKRRQIAGAGGPIWDNSSGGWGVSSLLGMRRPVRLPPGGGGFGTGPAPTGSAATKTIGIVEVA